MHMIVAPYFAPNLVCDLKETVIEIWDKKQTQLIKIFFYVL